MSPAVQDLYSRKCEIYVTKIKREAGEVARLSAYFPGKWPGRRIWQEMEEGAPGRPLGAYAQQDGREHVGCGRGVKPPDPLPSHRERAIIYCSCSLLHAQPSKHFTHIGYITFNPHGSLIGQPPLFSPFYKWGN